jgi:hypothetical protein
MSTTVVALAGSAVILFGWFVVITTYALVSRPRELEPGPPTMELGAEPPGVVNLLVTRCELTAAAADATLLDLAARRVLQLHQAGPDPTDLLIRVRVNAPEGLTAYERRVFERFAAYAGDRFVPLKAVAKEYATGGPGWFQQLRAEIIADAQARNMVNTRTLNSPLILCALLTGMALACLAVLPFLPAKTGGVNDAIGIGAVLGWFCLAPVIATVLLLLATLQLRAPRQTELGRQAGRYWLGVGGWLAAHDSLADLPPAAVQVWDRYLAYGVALGVNPLADAALDLRVGRVARFTSRYAGRPHTVVARYPRDPFAYTQAGVRLAWSALVLALWAAVGVWAMPRAGGWPTSARLALLTVGGLLTLRAAYKLVRSAYAKLAPVTVTGLVLAAHPRRLDSTMRPRWIQFVLDDGRHVHTRPWLVRADRAEAVAPGMVIRMRAQRWTRYVLEIERPA